MVSDYYTNLFTVEKNSSAVATIGSWAPVWSTLGTFYGWIDYISGQEQMIAAQYIGKASHIIGCSSTVSWVTSAHRIKDSDSKIYRILNVDNPLRKSHHMEFLLEYNETDNLST